MANLEFDLSSGCIVTNKSIYMGKSGFAYCSNFKLMDIFNNGNHNNMTVEILYKYSEGSGNIFGTGTAGGFIFSGTEEKVGSATCIKHTLDYIGSDNGNPHVYSYKNSINFSAGYWITASFVFKTDSIDWYMNEELITTIDHGLLMEEGWGLGIMCNPIDASGGVASTDKVAADVAAFRVYDRALTLEEVLSNHRKDNERFN